MQEVVECIITPLLAILQKIQTKNPPKSFAIVDSISQHAEKPEAYDFLNSENPKPMEISCLDSFHINGHNLAPPARDLHNCLLPLGDCCALLFGMSVLSSLFYFVYYD